MRSRAVYIILSAMMVLGSFAASYGQLMPERSMIRQGNRDYDRGRYADAELDYRGALEKVPGSYIGAYDLGNSLYKQERYREAALAYGVLALDSLVTQHSDKVFFNLGNAMFKEREFEQALNMYAMAMRLNPDDMEAKFNYAYTKKMLENEDNRQDGGGGGGGQDQNEDQDQENNQHQDNNDEGQQDQQNPGDQQGEQDQPQPADPDQSEGGISQADAERMLDAMQMSEDRTQEKVNEQKGTPVVGRSGKNW